MQAFSRTNIILNSVKSHGNIVSFRDIEEHLNNLIKLFGEKDDVSESILIHTFEEYYKKGYENNKGEHKKSYIEIIEKLKSFDTQNLTRNKQEKEFVKIFDD